MHYGKGFFSKLAILQLPTMTITKELDEGQDIEIGQRIALSDMDILQANLLYKCDGKFQNAIEKFRILLIALALWSRVS